MEPLNGEDLYLAGERVPPGRYRRLDSNVIICLEREDYLPASLDGHIAGYMRVRASWDQIQEQQAEGFFRPEHACGRL